MRKLPKHLEPKRNPFDRLVSLILTVIALGVPALLYVNERHLFPFEVAFK